MKKLTKTNGFPTLYGYACGCGKSHYTAAGDYITLFPFCNGLDVKGGGKWAQFGYADYPSPAAAAKAAEREFKRRISVRA